MNMIEDDISRYLVAPWCTFPSQKHSFLKYPIPEIPEDFENKSGTDRVWKKTPGSGRVSGTRWALDIWSTRLCPKSHWTLEDFKLRPDVPSLLFLFQRLQKRSLCLILCINSCHGRTDGNGPWNLPFRCFDQCATIPKIWPKPNPELFSDTKFFRYRIRYFFRYQIFPIPNPILFSIPIFFDTESETI